MFDRFKKLVETVKPKKMASIIDLDDKEDLFPEQTDL